MSFKINIRGESLDYHSGWSPNPTICDKKWRNQMDYFSIGEKIGKYTCFVKRFSRKPSAWGLITNTKGKKYVNLPFVYDAVETQEFGDTAYYMFCEHINGQTLEEALKQYKGRSIDKNKLFSDILSALKDLHDNHYWFGDFDDKNIFFDESNKRYYLIDNDSCWHENIKPNSDSNQEGGIPGQNYSNFVYDFYRNILKENTYDYGSISGKSLNYLQLIGLCIRVQYYFDDIYEDDMKAMKSYSRKFEFDKAQKNAYYKNNDLFKAIFNKPFKLKQDLNISLLNTIQPYLFKKEVTVMVEEPKISKFDFKITNIDAKQVQFSWVIEHGESASLKSIDNTFITNIDKGRMIHDGNYVVSNSGKYILEVFNSQGKKDSKEVYMDFPPSIVVPPLPPMPPKQNYTLLIVGIVVTVLSMFFYFIVESRNFIPSYTPEQEYKSEEPKEEVPKEEAKDAPKEEAKDAPKEEVKDTTLRRERGEQKK